MDTSTLHSVAEDLAAMLSEVTVGDLRRPVRGTTGDVGALYLDLIARSVSLAETVGGASVGATDQPESRSRTALDAPLDDTGGCGLEAGYRRAATLAELAFASWRGDPETAGTGPDSPDVVSLYETMIRDTVVSTWDLAQVLGFSHWPDPAISRLSLRSAVLSPPPAPAKVDAFRATLHLLGRQPI